MTRPHNPKQPPKRPEHFRRLPRFRLLAVVAVSRLCAAACAADGYGFESIRELKQLSLDELLDIEVTSVSRTNETYRDAAAALTVLTDENIRRSAATTIPGLLRGVPGLHVAQRDSSAWAVSSRGFSSISSEKLLVLSDTRSIYTPLFSGVMWDVQDHLLADIERIEVIRGPGAALWGSNAVNGVINITTKHAADTHGTRIETVSGTTERAILSARYGAGTSGGLHFRVFGQYSQRDESFHSSQSADDWEMGHLGFRADWAPQPDDEFTLQGDIYRGDIGKLAPSVSIIGRPGPTRDLVARVAGGNILGRWRHFIDADSDIQLRAYYDRTHRDDPSFTDDLHTFDVDLQHRFAVLDRHEVIWGVNHRYTDNRNRGKGIFGVSPQSSKDQLLSGFLQDKIAITDELHVTVGTKIEDNEFSGFEVQPSLRAAWNLAPRHTVWAAASRAARIPTRLERDIFIDVVDPASNPIVRLLGNRDFGAEELRAFELGYRWRATDALHFDFAAFENRYDDLASLELGEPFVDPVDGRTVVPIVNQNLTDGRSQGVESFVTFSPSTWWRLSASYSYLSIDLDPSGADINRGEFYENASPRHQFALTSYIDLPGGFELDAQFRQVGALRRLPTIATGEGIPGYEELDLRLSWRASERMELSVIGQNLLHHRHVEFGSPDARGAIRRAVYAKAVLNF